MSFWSGIQASPSFGLIYIEFTIYTHNLKHTSKCAFICKYRPVTKGDYKPTMLHPCNSPFKIFICSDLSQLKNNFISRNAVFILCIMVQYIIIKPLSQAELLGAGCACLYNQKFGCFLVTPQQNPRSFPTGASWCLACRTAFAET